MTARIPSLAPPDTRSWPRTIATLVIGLAAFALFLQGDRAWKDLSFSALIENGRAAAMHATTGRAPTRSLDVPSVQGSGDSVSLSSLAEMTYEEVMGEIEARGSRMAPTLDGHPTYMGCGGIPPGMGTGMHPRFFNCGDGPGTIYIAEDDDRLHFIIGRWKVLDYVDGEWQTLGFVENQTYIYNPSSPPE